MREKITKINLNTDGSTNPRLTGIEHYIPWGCVRKFDEGSRAWFIYGGHIPGKVNYTHIYVLHFTPDAKFSPWRLTVTFYPGRDESYEFYGSGMTRKEAFNQVRRQIYTAKKALRKYKVSKYREDPA